MEACFHQEIKYVIAKDFLNSNFIFLIQFKKKSELRDKNCNNRFYYVVETIFHKYHANLRLKQTCANQQSNHA